MPTATQRIVLLIASALGLAAFVVQPKLNLNDLPMGYGAFYAREVEVGPSRFEFVHADYRALGATFAALTFVTGCLYLATGGKNGE